MPPARHEIRGHLELKNIYFSSTDGIFRMGMRGGDEEMKEAASDMHVYIYICGDDDDGDNDCGIFLVS